MFESSVECVRCGTPLKKQVIGSNVFYYCRKCGCTSSAAFASVSSHSTAQLIK
ncbi:MAG: hypothetical protein ACHQXK_00375 [Methanosarcina thermophila]|uniref:Uncharacterized protein n=1 Tax=Methanosarcina thermophila TaxID=2210 RepID=A0A1I6Z6X4_METTE|nr:hypothetical protein [Methanosarcina thermophila]NLU55942.1 hypothetical protein [Methanosarcina thermophila]SFT58449.1 hypothetical protein SAMN02910340_01337 [Methanosarcina thermophila]HOA69839.1 hypothetical protein [Methanosarcina thermophila]HOQ65339.1 hypothetical protein [Methanosarcina thermophila]HPT82191.1 hypothetical protein [Methanosarcina thermophila]